MVGASSDAVDATSTPEEPESLVDKFVVEKIVNKRNGQAIQNTDAYEARTFIIGLRLDCHRG